MGTLSAFQISLDRIFSLATIPCVGAVWHADDIAFSIALLSPCMLRQHLFTWYQDLNRITHQKGRLAVFHRDGALKKVFDYIFACGLDGLNRIEPKALDINEAKKNYGSWISLFSNINSGYTLTRGNPE